MSSMPNSRRFTHGFASISIEARFIRQAISYFRQIVLHRVCRVNQLEALFNLAWSLPVTTVTTLVGQRQFRRGEGPVSSQAGCVLLLEA